MHPDRQRVLLWSIPVATLVIFFVLGWNQPHPHGDAQGPQDPAAEVQAILLDALALTRRIPYAVERDRVLLGIAAGLARTGETGAALHVASTVTGASLRAQAFFLVVYALARDGRTRPSERAVVLLGAARGVLERAHKIGLPGPEVVCEVPSRTVDLLLRRVNLERLVEHPDALS